MGSEKWGLFERVMALWALALGSIALFVVLVSLGVWASDSSANVASWVQAIGSIAAIASGFGVAAYQLRKQREVLLDAEINNQRNQTLACLERFASALDDAERTLRAVQGSLSDREAQVPYKFLAMGITNSISLIDLLLKAQLPVPGMALLGSGLRDALLAVEFNLQIASEDATLMPIFLSSDPLPKPIAETIRVSQLASRVVGYGTSWIDREISDVGGGESRAIYLEKIKLMEQGISEILHLNPVSPSDTDQSQTPPQPAAYQGPTAGS